MEQKIKEQPKIINQSNLRFYPFISSTPKEEAVDNEKEKLFSFLSHDFDYELKYNLCWHIHIDIAQDVPYIAKSKTRVTFEAKCEWGHPFIPEILY